MASLEEEIRDLKEKNNELVQKVQYWKMLAGQRENEKLNLMKEINELRLKLSKLRNHGNIQASNLDAALQSASEKALAHLVRASSEIARTIDLTKAYMRDREELDTSAPHWSSLGGTPASVKKDKVHRVPPLMMGGQSIQPVVALTMLDTSNPRSVARSPNANRSVTPRAVPMHIMLQDLHIPLTRIDADRHTQNMDTEDANNADDSSEHSQIDEGEGLVLEESQRMSEEELDSMRVLDVVAEDSEPENDEVVIPRSRIENPLEGPSWMLESGNQVGASKSRCNLEPDSTTELEGFRTTPPADNTNNTQQQHLVVLERRVSREFSPTVRRRKRASCSSPPAAAPAATPRRSDHYSPRPLSSRRLSNSGRVLKVLVAKMRLDGDNPAGPAMEAEGSPPKRPAPGAALAFDAPSPNGATVPGVIVSEASQDELESLGSGEPAPRRKQRTHHRSQTHQRTNSTDDADSMDVDEQPTSRRDREHSSRERHDTERRDRNIDTSRRTNSRERKEKHQTERQRTNSDDRAEQQRSMISGDRPEGQRNSSVERTNRANSADRSLERHEGRRQASVRDRSVDRHEERTNSRISDDSVGPHEPRGASSDGRYLGRVGSCDSDSGSGGEREGRARRQRKQVVYKEKPLNRKMRR